MGGPGYIDGSPHNETNNCQPAQFRNSDGLLFGSAEQYFQWCKCVNDEDRSFILRSGTGADVCRASRRVKLRSDWEVVKVRMMLDGNQMKFEQNPELRQLLVATTGRIQFFASTPFWCKWNGRIMELLRAQFRRNGEQDDLTIARMTQKIEGYEAAEQEKLAY